MCDNKNRKNDYISYEEIVAVRCGVDEQETSVAFYREDDSIVWFTSDNTMLTIFKNKMKDAPDVYKAKVASYDENGYPAGYLIEMPRDLLSFKTKHRRLSQEEKNKFSNRMQEYYKNKNK